MDKKKEDVIVYGLGNEFIYWKSWIEKKYNILGYADSNMEKAKQYRPFMSMKEIKASQNNVLITSTDYYDEIKSLLMLNGIDEKRIDGGIQTIIAPPIIVVTLWGGFGGLMTSYCFAKSLQKLHPNVPLYFDMTYYDVVDRDDLKKVPYNFEKLFHISLGSQRADSDTIKRAKKQGMTIEKDEEVGVYCDKYLKVEQGHIMGYWSTRKYFFCIKDKIKDWFEFDKQYINCEQDKVLEKIKSTESVAVWIRRGDYLKKEIWSELGYICNEGYYDKAIEYIKKKHPNAEFFIFSDDQEYIQERYSEYNLMLYDQGTSAMVYYAMYFMALCRHMILANSGYSWWAAYLHELYGNSGTIIAPKVWIHDRPCTDVWEDSWIRM